LAGTSAWVRSPADSRRGRRARRQGLDPGGDFAMGSDGVNDTLRAARLHPGTVRIHPPGRRLLDGWSRGSRNEQSQVRRRTGDVTVAEHKQRQADLPPRRVKSRRRRLGVFRRRSSRAARPNYFQGGDRAWRGLAAPAIRAVPWRPGKILRRPDRLCPLPWPTRSGRQKRLPTRRGGRTPRGADSRRAVRLGRERTGNRRQGMTNIGRAFPVKDNFGEDGSPVWRPSQIPRTATDFMSCGKRVEWTSDCLPARHLEQQAKAGVARNHQGTGTSFDPRSRVKEAGLRGDHFCTTSIARATWGGTRARARGHQWPHHPARCVLVPLSPSREKMKPPHPGYFPSRVPVRASRSP